MSQKTFALRNSRRSSGLPWVMGAVAEGDCGIVLAGNGIKQSLRHGVCLRRDAVLRYVSVLRRQERLTPSGVKFDAFIGAVSCGFCLCFTMENVGLDRMGKGLFGAWTGCFCAPFALLFSLLHSLILLQNIQKIGNIPKKYKIWKTKEAKLQWRGGRCGVEKNVHNLVYLHK